MQKSNDFIIAVMDSFSPGMLEKDNVTRWILERIYINGPVCPVCRSRIEGDKNLRSFYSLRRVKCIKCNGQSTAAAGTVLHNSKYDIRLVYLMALMLGMGIPEKTIATGLHTSLATVNVWKLKFAAIAESEYQPQCPQ